MLVANSCSQDEFINETLEEDFVEATFSIATTYDMGTRADNDIIGKGLTADVVVCSVYDNNGTELGLKQTVEVKTAEDGKRVAEYNVRLAKGQAYRVAFFAYNKKANAYDVSDLKNIRVNDNQDSNKEDRDAFTNYVDITAEQSMKAISQPVVLKRPFAQLNLGIDDTELNDAANAGVVVSKSQITVSNVYSAFSAFNNAVVGEAGEMTFAMNNIPNEKLYADVDNDGVNESYTYLALNYLLVGDVNTEKSMSDIEFVWETEDGKTNSPTTNFINIPVQRNYRTNIIGKLLTNPATFNITIDASFTDENGDQNPDYNVDIVDVFYVQNLEQLKKAFVEGGKVILENDIEFKKMTAVEPGAEVYLNLNGKTTSNTLLYVKEGAKLVIDGNGTIDLKGVTTMCFFAPYGELIIENGTFIREYTNIETTLFMGVKSTSSNVTINGGYFDAGYYNTNAADIEDILAGTKELKETDDDIVKRGNSKDANLVRVALKKNVSVMLNHSGYGSFKIYGGSFVGANPAWGDEGCMLPTMPYYLRPWSYYQGALLDGQTYNENRIVLPEGYSIVNGTTDDGRPIYTVSYIK